MIKIAIKRTDQNKGYDDSEWNEFLSLNREESDLYFSEIGNAGRIRWVIERSHRFFEDLGKQYANGRVKFDDIAMKCDKFFKGYDDQYRINEFKTRKEQENGYSWEFLSSCNLRMNISLRRLELEIGIGKDTLNRHINKYRKLQDLYWDTAFLEHEIKIKQKRIKSLNL